MADEISVSVKLYAAKGGAYLGSETTSLTLDMSGTHMASGTQSIGTSDEIIDIPADVSGDRYVLIKSLEAEGGNYVEIGAASGGSFSASVHQKLLAGRAILMIIPSANSIYAKANTASVNIEWKACQA